MLHSKFGFYFCSSLWLRVTISRYPYLGSEVIWFLFLSFKHQSPNTENMWYVKQKIAYRISIKPIVGGFQLKTCLKWNKNAFQNFSSREIYLLLVLNFRECLKTCMASKVQQRNKTKLIAIQYQVESISLKKLYRKKLAM